MITLTFSVDSISTVLQVYNQILIERAGAEGGTYTTVSGLGPIDLVGGQSIYTETDEYGTSTDWYKSRYYSTVTSNYSGYSSPVLGDVGDLYYNPIYPPEVSYGTSQQLVIDRIRLLMGDPLNLRREYGEEAESSIHSNGKVYELLEKGWPVSVTMNNVQYNDSSNPTVNGYRYLIFNDFIDTTSVVCSGTETRQYGVDIWYYSFRHSSKQIMDAYDNVPPPAGLTTTTVTAEHYMLQTAIDLLMQENWEHSVEDGAIIRDGDSLYSPEPGLRFRENLIDKLQKRLDYLVKIAVLGGIQGIRVE